MAKTESGPAIKPIQTGNGQMRKPAARKRSWTWPLIFVAAVALAGWYFAKSGGPSEVEVAKASVRALEASYTAEAYVEGKEFQLAPESSGRLVALNVREGSVVKAGQVLLVLDSSEQQAAVNEAAAARAAASAAVDQARSQLAAARRDIEARISAAAAGVRQAQANLRKIEAGARKEEIEQAEHRLEAARVARERADRDLERASFLYGEGAIPKASFDAAEAAARAAQAVEGEAQAALDLLKQGASGEDRTIAQRAVDSANAELRVATSARGQLRPYQDAITAALARVGQADAGVARAKIGEGKSELKSPVDGVVTKSNFEPGGMLIAGTPALTISTRKDLHIEAEISSEDAGKIKAGMPVIVTSPAYPGQNFKATLTSLLPVGELKPDAAIRTRIIRARIMLDSNWELFRPGMEVDVEGRTTLKQALCVPSDALNLTGEKTTVFAVRDGKVSEIEVKTGYANPDYTEILSGLKDGEQVVVTGKEGLAADAKVRVKPSGAKS